MENETSIIGVEKRIRGRVKTQMEKTQREYYLNEQLKAIQKELGEIEDGKDETTSLKKSIQKAKMPKEVEKKCIAELKKSLEASQTKVLGTFQMVRDIQTLQKDFDDFNQEYRSLHFQVRSIQKEIRTLDQELEELKQRKNRLVRSKQDALQEELNRIDETIKTLEEIKTEILAQVPENWKSQRALFEKQNKDLRSNRMKYRRNVDEAYEPIKTINGILKDTDALRNQRNKIESIGQIIMQQEPDGAMKQIKLIEKELGNIEGSSSIKSKISKARRALKGKNPNREKANKFWKEALTIFDKEMQWRQKALSELIQPLDAYDSLIKDSIGLRSQKKLGLEQAKSIAVCKSSHQDISLNF